MADQIQHTYVHTVDPQSVEISENAKGEAQITVKIYAADLKAAADEAYAIFTGLRKKLNERKEGGQK